MRSGATASRRAPQKYLDQLAESGKICERDGKQRVFTTQDGIPMDPAQTEAMEADIKTKTAALADAKSEQKKHATLRRLAKTLTVPQIRLKTDALAKHDGTRSKPLRASKGEDVSPETLRKTEDAFITSVEQWSSRRRKFTDAFDTVLEPQAPRRRWRTTSASSSTRRRAARRAPQVGGRHQARARSRREKKFKTSHA